MARVWYLLYKLRLQKTVISTSKISVIYMNYQLVNLKFVGKDMEIA